MQVSAKHERLVGSVVDGKWKLGRRLGVGATSTIYEATHRNGHRAALKILHASASLDRVAVERFLRGAYAANRVDHPSTVKVQDDGVAAGAVYLVLDLLEGETLEERRVRAGGTLPLELVAKIGGELMAAIDAVHEAGIVHRDLEPKNVFLTATGEVKLLDFGSARMIDQRVGATLTRRGASLGTPAFMSPEQARGERDAVDERSDVWSLGAILFTLLTGEYVHDGPSAEARLIEAALRPARLLATVAPSIDARVAAVVDRALAFDKDSRWADVRAMRTAFAEAVRAAVVTERLAAARRSSNAPADVATPPRASVGHGRTPPARPAMRVPAARGALAAAPLPKAPPAPRRVTKTLRSLPIGAFVAGAAAGVLVALAVWGVELDAARRASAARAAIAAEDAPAR